MELNLLRPMQKVDKKVSQNSISSHSHFPEAVDQIFKWAPLASVLLLDAAGVKTKNDLKDQLLIITTGEALMNTLVEPLKNNVDRMRPNHSLDRNSFPSRHTATAFLGAEIL